MTKKLIALTAATLSSLLFSLDACAGYIQYDLAGPGVSGYLVQHDDDHSIAFYQVFIDTDSVYARFAAWYDQDNITAASTRFPDGGPTNFSAYDSLSKLYLYNIAFDFRPTATDGAYGFTAHYVQKPDPEHGDEPWVGLLRRITHDFHGVAHVGSVDPDLVTHLDSIGGYGDGLQRLVPVPADPPAEVPAPSGLALIGIGLAGLAGVLRRHAR